MRVRSPQDGARPPTDGARTPTKGGPNPDIQGPGPVEAAGCGCGGATAAALTSKTVRTACTIVDTFTCVAGAGTTDTGWNVGMATTAEQGTEATPPDLVWMKPSDPWSKVQTTQSY